jgi:hypothetical protein
MFIIEMDRIEMLKIVIEQNWLIVVKNKKVRASAIFKGNFVEDYNRPESKKCYVYLKNKIIQKNLNYLTKLINR